MVDKKGSNITMSLIVLFEVFVALCGLGTFIGFVICDGDEQTMLIIISAIMFLVCLMLPAVRVEAYRDGQADALNGKFEYELSEVKTVVSKIEKSKTTASRPLTPQETKKYLNTYNEE